MFVNMKITRDILNITIDIQKITSDIQNITSDFTFFLIHVPFTF